MRVTFLGTSGGVPTRERNVAGIALGLPQRGEWWLFDCGEATQHQIQRSNLNLGGLTRIFITHMHGDHIFGLPGLLASGRLAGPNRQVHIYGPSGLAEYVRACWQLTEAGQVPPAEAHVVEPGEVYRDEQFTISCLPLKHRVPAVGYRVTELPRPGRFRVERAAALGVPSGPLFGLLKRGESITLEDGRRIDAAELSDPPEAGRSVVYSGDTTYCEATVRLAQAADVLIHEATFSGTDERLARRSSHSTAVMAAQVAQQAEVKMLVLTHISPRYAAGKAINPEDLLSEARAIFPQTILAHDFLSFEVPRRSPE